MTQPQKMKSLVWLLLVLPAAVLAGKKAHKNAMTVEKTLSFSDPSFDCKFSWTAARLYDSCLVEVTLSTDTAFTISSEAEDEESNEGVIMYLREANTDFGSEQQVRFDRMTNNQASGSGKKRMITIPKEAVKRAMDINIFKADVATYYVLLTKPKKTRTSKPTKITLSKDDYGAKVETITLGATVKFDNKYKNGAFESWHYFQVDTSSVAAPKAIQVYLSFDKLIGATYEASDNEYFYRAHSPDLFVSSRSPALLEVDRYETNVQSGAFAYEAFSGSQWDPGKEGQAMSWHQPEHTTWNKMFIAVRVPMAAQGLLGGRRLMGGALEPNVAKAPTTKYTIRVTASRVSSCTVPIGVGQMGVSQGGAKLKHPRLNLSRRRGAHFNLDYPVHPDYTKNKQALLRARMNAANLQLPSGLFSSLPWRRGTCDEDVDRRTWQALHMPECDLETLYTVPQCRSDCEYMSNCVNFMALACDKLPEHGCTRYYSSVPYGGLGQAVPWGQFFLACILSFIIGVIVLRSLCWLRKKLFKCGCMMAPANDTDDEGSSERSDSSSEDEWEEEVCMPKGRRSAVADIRHPNNDQGQPKKGPAVGHPTLQRSVKHIPADGTVKTTLDRSQKHIEDELEGTTQMTPLAQTKLEMSKSVSKPLTPVQSGWVIGPGNLPMHPAPHLITAGNLERPRQQPFARNDRPVHCADVGYLPIPSFRGVPMSTVAQSPAAQMVAQPYPVAAPAAAPTMPAQMVSNPNPMAKAALPMQQTANPLAPPVATNIAPPSESGTIPYGHPSQGQQVPLGMTPNPAASIPMSNLVPQQPDR